jgi:hypothetical protein
MITRLYMIFMMFGRPPRARSASPPGRFPRLFPELAHACGNGSVALVRSVQVDERGPRTGVAHPLHPLAEVRALARCHGVTGMP